MYRHYSSRNPNKELRGKPEIGPNGLERRPASDKPDCNNCFRALAWTPDNRSRYEAWMLAKSGSGQGPEGWAVVALEETERSLQPGCPLYGDSNGEA